jgi:arsenate reductase
LGRVNPFALRLLESKGHDITRLRSKSWDEFSNPHAPGLDLVITVCDNAAGEPCPLWPGSPIKAHWGIADPAAVNGSDEEIMSAFELAHDRLERRIKAFLSLDMDGLTYGQLQARLDEIGQIKD